MKTIAFLIAMLGFTICLNAQTPPCNAAQNGVSKMRSSALGLNLSLSYLNWVAKSNEAVEKFNRAMQNKNNTYGPDRSLKFGGIGVRTILKQQTHTFVMVPAFEKSLDFVINKFEGNAKIGIIVCSSDRSGRTKTEYSVTFEAGETNTTRSFQIDNAKGKIISWVVQNYSQQGNAEYRIASTTSFPQTPPSSVAKPVTAKMWNAYGDWKPSDSRATWKQRAHQAIPKFDGISGANNESFEFGEILNQTIDANAFHTITTPPAFNNSIDFTFIKYGKGEAGITICTTTESGEPKYAYSYIFGESDTNTTRGFEIDNTKGRVVSILIRNYSKNKSFSYRITD